MIAPDAQLCRNKVVMDYIKANPGPTIKEISQGTGMSFSVVSGILNGLESAGVITRTPSVPRSIRLVTDGDSGEVSALQALVGDQAREIERLWALLEEYKADRMRLIWARARLKETRCRVATPDGEVLTVPAVDDLRGVGVSFEMLTNYSER